MPRSGFTLVELSIVLVIIGLIVGGVVGGQALIANARMSKQVQQLQQFKLAFNAFGLQYDAIPGDFSEATDYWPSSGTTSGDGDGVLERSTGAVTTGTGDFDGELPLFFQHLSLAEVVQEVFDGSSALGAGYPELELVPGMGMVVGQRSVNEAVGCTQGVTKLYMTIALPDEMPALGVADNAHVFFPKDVKRLDQKLDNGIAISGALCSWNASGAATGNCHDTAGQYVVANAFATCRSSYRLE